MGVPAHRVSEAPVIDSDKFLQGRMRKPGSLHSGVVIAPVADC